jgi:dCMP deaminase
LNHSPSIKRKEKLASKKMVSRPDWDEFFMGVAILASERTKPGVRKNGACIVDPKYLRILDIGYTQKPVVGLYVDSIKNAIDRRSQQFFGCYIYVTSYPSTDSADLIAYRGFKKVIHMGKEEDDKHVAANIFKNKEIEVIPYEKRKATIGFESV